VPDQPGPVLDTLGAGDATVSAMVAGSLAVGPDPSLEQAQACLESAMRVAAATCPSWDGLLQVPDARPGQLVEDAQ
jgi:fructokinase